MISHHNMRNNFKSKSAVNLLTGLTYQIINTLMSLVLPYLFITKFGSETNGLLNSIAQLFVYLELLEAGVGAATIQALYKPIACNDHDSVNSILSATKEYYNRTGLIYLVVLLVISIIYPFLVDSALPNHVIITIILLQGLSSVWRYFVQAKYNLLLKADGRIYILYILMLGSSMFRNIGKIVAINLGYDIVVVQIIHLIISIAESTVVLAIIKRKYSWLNTKSKPDYKSIGQKNYVLVQTVAWLIFNHTDIMLLTIMCRDLKIVSVYSLYSLIFNAVQNVLESIRNSYQFKLGQKYALSQMEAFHFYSLYRKIYMILAFILCTICYILIVPFIKLYTRGVIDTNYLLRYLPEFFFACKVLYTTREVYRQPVEAAGKFKKTKYIMINEMIINLLLSLLLIPFFNIYGALIGTFFALLYGITSLMLFDYKEIFGIKTTIHLYIEIFFLFLISISGVLICRKVFIEPKSYFSLIFTGLGCMAIIILVFFPYALICLRNGINHE